MSTPDSHKRLRRNAARILLGGSLSVCLGLLAACSILDRDQQEAEFPARTPSSPSEPSATNQTAWRPAEERYRFALEHGPANLQGMLLTGYLFDVLEDQQELSQAPPTDWNKLMADQVLLFAPLTADGHGMQYALLPSADAEPVEETAGIWLGGWTGETRINISSSNIRRASQSFSFKLEAPSQASPELASSRDKRRQLTYVRMARAIIQHYVALTGKMPTSYGDVLKIHALSHDLDPAWNGPVKTIEVAVNHSIPAIRLTYIKPDGTAQNSYEVYTIDQKAGTVTSEVLSPPAAVNHPASHADYVPLYSAKLPLLDPQPNDGQVTSMTPDSATSAQ